MNPCDHSRDKIEWEARPETEGDSLFYDGHCVCGQAVEEQYNSIGIFTVPEGDEERRFISE